MSRQRSRPVWGYPRGVSGQALAGLEEGPVVDLVSCPRNFCRAREFDLHSPRCEHGLPTWKLCSVYKTAFRLGLLLRIVSLSRLLQAFGTQPYGGYEFGT